MDLLAILRGLMLFLLGMQPLISIPGSQPKLLTFEISPDSNCCSHLGRRISASIPPPHSHQASHCWLNFEPST
ncbi:hypothetical protein K470DRAFT_256525 [Piedraia hortae CBS 480.64]|uniref:Uncharacterized protein n=1 Tax=Piedraia hortae CBS 480.64 TaxID=1314780 RepID=A0A6A7C3A1_9PEZI|nr:hypothetical protein K470DRAFT_256525 [Piedraia hortae CBS 480.64]